MRRIIQDQDQCLEKVVIQEAEDQALDQDTVQGTKDPFPDLCLDKKDHLVDLCQDKKDHSVDLCLDKKGPLQDLYPGREKLKL